MFRSAETGLAMPCGIVFACTIVGFSAAAEDEQRPMALESVKVNEGARIIVPMFMTWGITDKRPTGVPREKAYEFPSGKAARYLKRESFEFIYISWSDRVQDSTFQWKYVVATGRVVPLTMADCERFRHRSDIGILNVAEQATFTVPNAVDGVFKIHFDYNWSSVYCKLRQVGKTFQVVGKPALSVH